MINKMTGMKGYAAEESLRSYFRSIGYFSVRGIPLTYKKYDVTDVDLWLYIRATSLTIERTCVDVKHRRTPQAMERVLWTKGLKEVLGVDRAIVVTSDNRQETRNFGAEHGVMVLQGNFLHRVIANFPLSNRISEEELVSILKIPCVVNSNIDWRHWYRGQKAKLLDSLNFDGCNSYLLAIQLLLDELIATGKSSEAAIRLLYIVIAYFLISLDYTSRSFTDLDMKDRSIVLTDGFRYGQAGRQRTEEVVHLALQILANVGRTDPLASENLRREFDRQVNAYRAEILSDYFSKSDALKKLFSLACGFEELAYSIVILQPNELISEQKGIIGLICDFLELDRKKIL